MHRLLGLCSLLPGVVHPEPARRAGREVKPKDIPKAIVDRDLCTACEFCIDICPFDCIHLVDDPLAETSHYKLAEVDAAPCVSCRLCETVCDKDAIYVPNPITQAKLYLSSVIEHG